MFCSCGLRPITVFEYFVSLEQPLKKVDGLKCRNYTFYGNIRGCTQSKIDTTCKQQVLVVLYLFFLFP